jgi:hypothetical protein
LIRYLKAHERVDVDALTREPAVFPTEEYRERVDGATTTFGNASESVPF